MISSAFHTKLYAVFYTMHNNFSNFLCYAFLCSFFVQYRTISFAMTRTGSYAYETGNLQTPCFKYAFGESKNCRRSPEAQFTSVVSNAKMYKHVMFRLVGFHLPLASCAYKKYWLCDRYDRYFMLKKISCLQWRQIVVIIWFIRVYIQQSVYKDIIGLWLSYGWLKP